MSDLSYINKPRKYFLFSTGTTLKEKCYNTRKEAESAMNSYCEAHNIKIECTEDDKHYRKYSNHNGVRFYINRI